MDIIAIAVLNTNRAVQCLYQKGQWLSKTKREEKEDKQMDMTIPAIILFGAMGVGLAMTPSIFREFWECVKEAFREEEDEEKIYM